MHGPQQVIGHGSAMKVRALGEPPTKVVDRSIQQECGNFEASLRAPSPVSHNKLGL